MANQEVVLPPRGEKIKINELKIINRWSFFNDFVANSQSLNK